MREKDKLITNLVFLVLILLPFFQTYAANIVPIATSNITDCLNGICTTQIASSFIFNGVAYQYLSYGYHTGEEFRQFTLSFTPAVSVAKVINSYIVGKIDWTTEQCCSCPLSGLDCSSLIENDYKIAMDVAGISTGCFLNTMQTSKIRLNLASTPVLEIYRVQSNYAFSTIRFESDSANVSYIIDTKQIKEIQLPNNLTLNVDFTFPEMGSLFTIAREISTSKIFSIDQPIITPDGNRGLFYSACGSDTCFFDKNKIKEAISVKSMSCYPASHNVTFIGKKTSEIISTLPIADAFVVSNFTKVSVDESESWLPEHNQRIMYQPKIANILTHSFSLDGSNVVFSNGIKSDTFLSVDNNKVITTVKYRDRKFYNATIVHKWCFVSSSINWCSSSQNWYYIWAGSAFLAVQTCNSVSCPLLPTNPNALLYKDYKISGVQFAPGEVVLNMFYPVYTIGSEVLPPTLTVAQSNEYMYITNTYTSSVVSLGGQNDKQLEWIPDRGTFRLLNKDSFINEMTCFKTTLDGYEGSVCNVNGIMSMMNATSTVVNKISQSIKATLIIKGKETFKQSIISDVTLKCSQVDDKLELCADNFGSSGAIVVAVLGEVLILKNVSKCSTITLKTPINANVEINLLNPIEKSLSCKVVFVPKIISVINNITSDAALLISDYANDIFTTYKYYLIAISAVLVVIIIVLISVYTCIPVSRPFFIGIARLLFIPFYLVFWLGNMLMNTTYKIADKLRGYKKSVATKKTEDPTASSTNTTVVEPYVTPMSSYEARVDYIKNLRNRKTPLPVY